MLEKLIWLFITGSVVTVYFLKKYFGGSYCKCKSDIKGKVIIVTGANSGIGKETATILAYKGADVVLACQSVDRGLKAVKDIKEKTSNTSVSFEELDLSCFQSIIDFANRFRARGTKLYALVNNAGVFYIPHQLTVDGFDLTLQINYLGPALLTLLLLDQLKKGAPSRIVNIGSESHRFPTSLNILTLAKEQKDFDTFGFYGTTKLCLMLFSTKLAKLLNGSGVTVNIANPGNVNTNIYQHFPTINEISGLSLSRFLLWLQFKNPFQGAQTTLHLLTDPLLNDVSGKYFSECSERDVSSLAKSITLEEELWQSTLIWLQPFLKDATATRGVEL